MGKVGNQIVFAVNLIFCGLLMALHRGFDLHNLRGHFRISRREHIVGIKVVMHVGMQHTGRSRDGFFHPPPGVKMRNQKEGNQQSEQ